MKYAHIDNNNKLLGWYDSDIHSEIPTPNVEVTDKQWNIALSEEHNKVNEDGSTEAFDFRSAEEIAEARANEYKVLRTEAYPSLEEQMDMQYWDMVNGTTVWKDTIEAIKLKYPKEI